MYLGTSNHQHQPLPQVLNGDVKKTPAQGALSLLGVLFLVFLVRAVKSSVDEAVKETKAAQQQKQEQQLELEEGKVESANSGAAEVAV